jgi:hypothetical protein
MTSAAPQAITEATEEQVESPNWEGIRKQLDTGQRGIELKTFDDMYRFAQHVANSDLVPKQMRNVSNAIVAMQYGAELGVSPMVSLQKCAVIDSTPTFATVVLLALCLRSGKLYTPEFKQWHTGTPYEDDYTWHCQVRRIDGKILGAPKIGEFSVAKAKRAKLWEKQSRDGKPMPWQLYPDDLLCNRATLRALRWAFADVLYGVYGTDEMQIDQVMDALDLSESEESGQGEMQGIRERLTKKPEPATPAIPEPFTEAMAPEPEAAEPPAEQAVDQKPAGTKHPTYRKFHDLWMRIDAQYRLPMLADKRMALGFKFITDVAKKPAMEIMRIQEEVEKCIKRNEIPLKAEGE